MDWNWLKLKFKLKKKKKQENKLKQLKDKFTHNSLFGRKMCKSLQQITNTKQYQYIVLSQREEATDKGNCYKYDWKRKDYTEILLHRQTIIIHIWVLASWPEHKEQAVSC